LLLDGLLNPAAVEIAIPRGKKFGFTARTILLPALLATTSHQFRWPNVLKFFPLAHRSACFAARIIF